MLYLSFHPNNIIKFNNNNNISHVLLHLSVHVEKNNLNEYLTFLFSIFAYFLQPTSIVSMWLLRNFNQGDI